MRPFTYHASAAGLSAELRKPIPHNVGTLSPAVLSASGGHCVNWKRDIKIGEAITVGAVSTQVSGIFSEETQAWETMAMATIEDLNILEVLTAKRIVARLVSHWPVDGHVPEIVPTGTRIEGLRIDGKLIDPEMDFTGVARWAGSAAVVGSLCEDGGVITIPHFGTIWLAQFEATQYCRRLTMIRVKLGCPTEGWMEGGDVVGNGTPYPP